MMFSSMRALLVEGLLLWFTDASLAKLEDPPVYVNEVDFDKKQVGIEFVCRDGFDVGKVKYQLYGESNGKILKRGDLNKLCGKSSKSPRGIGSKSIKAKNKNKDNGISVCIYSKKLGLIQFVGFGTDVSAQVKEGKCDGMVPDEAGKQPAEKDLSKKLQQGGAAVRLVGKGCSYGDFEWVVDEKNNVGIVPNEDQVFSCDTDQPTVAPSPATPSQHPSMIPSVAPSVFPSFLPTAIASDSPSTFPTASLSQLPSMIPSQNPSVSPSFVPTAPPTLTPSAIPSSSPSLFPTTSPSLSPSCAPSDLPSPAPTALPTLLPSAIPSFRPTPAPTVPPTLLPSATPSDLPSAFPTDSPSDLPSVYPTDSPSQFPTTVPSQQPSTSTRPTLMPTTSPSIVPTLAPSIFPSLGPSATPSLQPSTAPSDSTCRRCKEIMEKSNQEPNSEGIEIEENSEGIGIGIQKEDAVVVDINKSSNGHAVGQVEWEEEDGVVTAQLPGITGKRDDCEKTCGDLLSTDMDEEINKVGCEKLCRTMVKDKKSPTRTCIIHELCDS